MRILKVEPGEAPYEKEMDNSLDAIQKEVGGGLFEPIYLDRDIVLCCNEEGKLLNLSLNRALRDDEGNVDLDRTLFVVRFSSSVRIATETSVL